MTIEDAKQRFMNGLDVVCVQDFDRQFKNSFGKLKLLARKGYNLKALWKHFSSMHEWPLGILLPLRGPSPEFRDFDDSQSSTCCSLDSRSLSPSSPSKSSLKRSYDSAFDDDSAWWSLQMDLQLFAIWCFHFNFLPSFRFPAIDGIPSNDWHGALMHQTFRQALPSQKKQLEFQCSLRWFEGVVPRWFDPHFVSNSLMHSVGRQGLHKWWRRPDLTQGISCDLIQKVVILLVIWVCNGFLNVASIYYVLPNCVWLVARWGVFSGAAGLCKAQGWSLKGYCK